MKLRKWLSAFLAVGMIMSVVSGCTASGEAAKNPTGNPSTTETQTAAKKENTPKQEKAEEVKEPKYVFLFIGDGMTYPQFELASSYLGALEEKDEILSGGKPLSFMEFPVAGSASTFDSTSFAPDSASTATSIATGHKTHSGVINMDETKTKPFTTIAEQLKAEKDYKIGVITSVNLNHATPAAFYAHQPSRGNYYEIGLELTESGFDYFAGGELLKPTGNDADKPEKDLYEIAKEKGYTVVKKQSELEKVTGGDNKVLAITEKPADSGSISYEIDREESEWALADYVRKGIEVLDNDKGFFMMVEGGKIDWACHANDAGSTIMDTLALHESVKEAVAFAEKHPEETLILVTGDHETGGLSIGFAGTNYDTYLDNIALQKISYAKYDEDYVTGYVEKQTPFADAMKDVNKLFGLITPENAAESDNQTLVLTDYEVSALGKAYEITLQGGFGEDAEGNSLQTAEEYIAYGTYTPFSVTVTHLLNHKSGVSFSSYSHTGLPAAVFADGVGAEDFTGTYDNTDIYKKLADLFKF